MEPRAFVLEVHSPYHTHQVDPDKYYIDANGVTLRRKDLRGAGGRKAAKELRRERRKARIRELKERRK